MNHIQQQAPQLYALIDINNCYVSCERIFQPQLNQKAVIVLSNNDGCVVARSEEAKALGITMAVPFFQIQDLVQQHQVQVFSSNYALYAEMSNRFHQLAAEFVTADEHELYSIDECFLKLTAYTKNHDIDQMALCIRQRMAQWLSLPVSIGIGRSKTEAKIANHLAKKLTTFNGICNLSHIDPCALEHIYAHLDVSTVWGVGQRQAKRLKALAIHSVYDLASSDHRLLKKHFNVVLARTVLELQGISCLELAQQPHAKQQIVASRSFGTRIYALDDLKEALGLYLQDALQRLREQKLCCTCLIVFLESSRFRSNKDNYRATLSYSLSQASDSLFALKKIALQLLTQIYRPDIAYKKCGVMLSDLVPKHYMPQDLWRDDQHHEIDARLMQSYENIQQRFGKHKIALGATALAQRPWHMQSAYRSPNYFSWAELPSVK
ncbi:Y-family DNA polymerase [Acinetobacter larvae]|uniref:UmuC domain-containing protein n=1 Tax=Acinetobacter larvae TaxID=1789224 RepID=A0A1B2M181_9GAMM|nr:Y-family DNA polymerase [Acinetobacter larvae]AOA58956.1 hypothetical protein BFG52_11750 [Acinetobacter larvae]